MMAAFIASIQERRLKLAFEVTQHFSYRDHLVLALIGLRYSGINVETLEPYFRLVSFVIAMAAWTFWPTNGKISSPTYA